jgi:hypothetical protein
LKRSTRQVYVTLTDRWRPFGAILHSIEMVTDRAVRSDHVKRELDSLTGHYFAEVRRATAWRPGSVDQWRLGWRPDGEKDSRARWRELCDKHARKHEIQDKKDAVAMKMLRAADRSGKL